MERRDRSLRRLHAELIASGISVSLATLKRYSRQYDWQGRLAELDAEARNRQREQDVAGAMAMHERHGPSFAAGRGGEVIGQRQQLPHDGRSRGEHGDRSADE